MKWRIAAAEQELSRVVREAAREPQLILNRDRIVAAVVDLATFAEFQTWKAAPEQRTLGQLLLDTHTDQVFDAHGLRRLW